MRKKAVLVVAFLALVAAGIAFRSSRDPVTPPPDDVWPRLVWTFEAPRPGFVVGAPVVSPEAIYLAVGHVHGFRQTGALYALDPATGKTKWVYDCDGEMLATVSTPLFSAGKIFVGEGLHNSFSCRLHCLDARTGQAKWTAPTSDHIEGGAAAAAGLIVFPAGNDGLYALNAESGKQAWNFRADLHIDSTPFVSGGRIFAGSGASGRYSATQVVCLDAKTGEPVWRTPVKLSAWGSPVVADGCVFVGLGNGKLTEKAETPAGGLACLDAATGEERWTFPTTDAVFGRPAIAAHRIVCGSRDGNLYGLTFEGKEAFRLPMGGPLMAPPQGDGDNICAVSVQGRIVYVNAANGNELWRYELARHGLEAKCYSAPTLSAGRLFVAGEMLAGQTGIISLHCFELTESSSP